MGKKKERWVLTILAFLGITGIFTFLLIKGGRPAESGALVLAGVNGESRVLYNYHPIRSGAGEGSRGAERDAGLEPAESGEAAPDSREDAHTGESGAGRMRSGSGVQGAPSAPGFIYHKVQRGESLWKIAKRYNTGVADIVKENSIRNPNVIYAGATLKITLRLS
jgi:LysM domain